MTSAHETLVANRSGREEAFRAVQRTDRAESGAGGGASNPAAVSRVLPGREEYLTDSEIDAVALTRALVRHHGSSRVRSVAELAFTATLYVGAWALALLAVQQGFWIGLIVTVPAAGLLVRLFILQHDCGHGSLFQRRRANDWVGRLLGVLTLTPYDYWRRTHASHHATAGNLDRRGMGDINTLTVREYLSRSRWGKWCYRMYRHPAIMFGVGPAYLFLVQHRLPVGLMRAGWTPWVSTMATNLAIVVVAGLFMWLVGIVPFLLIQVPIILMAASIGVWLFYVQHQFEDTTWAETPAWSFHQAALHGSSHYDLPPVLRWFTANIGIHHVHHLSSRIPFYRLPKVLSEHPRLGSIGRITLLESLRCARLALWDQDRRQLVSFKDLRSVPAEAV